MALVLDQLVHLLNPVVVATVTLEVALVGRERPQRLSVRLMVLTSLQSDRAGDYFTIYRK